MKELYEYLDQKVKLIDKNQKIWIGIVENYTSELDNEGEESIELSVEKSPWDNSKGYYEFYKSNIKSIEIIE